MLYLCEQKPRELTVCEAEARQTDYKELWPHKASAGKLFPNSGNINVSIDRMSGQGATCVTPEKVPPPIRNNKTILVLSMAQRLVRNAEPWAHPRPKQKLCFSEVPRAYLCTFY